MHIVFCNTICAKLLLFPTTYTPQHLKRIPYSIHRQVRMTNKDK